MTQMAGSMPYRPLRLRSPDGLPETFWVRVSDAAVAEWLAERAGLKRRGYPDRPPDIDAPTLRAWLPRPGEQALPYFRDGPAGSARPRDTDIFPVLTVVWHREGGITAKVLVSGMGDGSFLSRVDIVEPTGECRVDKARVYSSDADPEAVWAEIERIITFVTEAPMGWGPEDPLVTTYPDFEALDSEIEAAEADARAAGLLAPERVH
jgi:hypothetical protein